MKNLKKIFLGGKSFEMPLKKTWDVSYFEDDSTRAEIRFNGNQYPVLGIKLVSYDDPKINIDNRIKKYLIDPTMDLESSDLKIQKDTKKNNFLIYEAKLDTGEKVKVYRKAKIIGSRTVRVVTLALSWTDNPEARSLIENICKEIDSEFEKIIFFDKKTDLDEDANINSRLKKIKYKKLDLWNGLNFHIPASWPYELDLNNKSLAARVVGFDDAMLFIDTENFLLPNNFKTASDYITGLSSILKANNDYSNVILNSASDSVFLISCSKKEYDKEEKIFLEHYFWHYFFYKNGSFEKLNFVFVFPENRDKYLYHIPSLIDNSVKSIKPKK